MNGKLGSTERAGIDAMRGLLMLFVVAIHTNFVPDMHCALSAYGRAYGMLEEVLWISNSLFFTISGFLFFLPEQFNATVYRQKMRRRWHTLAVPYLLWNTLVWGFYLLCGYVAPAMVGSDVRPLGDTGLADVLRIYGSMDGLVLDSGPIDAPLWFLRNLMVLSAAAPLGYLIFRIHRLSFLLLPLVAMLPMPSGPLTSILFFGLGCYLGIWKVSPRRLAAYAWPALCLFLCLVALRFVIEISDGWYMLYVFFKHMAGMTLILSLALGYAERHPLVGKSLYNRSLFFIFAGHGVLSRVLTKATVHWLHPHDSVVLALLHGANVIVSIAACMLLYLLVNHLSPRLSRLLGARG